jgi:hypothetical protein
VESQHIRFYTGPLSTSCIECLLLTIFGIRLDGIAVDNRPIHRFVFERVGIFGCRPDVLFDVIAVGLGRDDGGRDRKTLDIRTSEKCRG